MACAQKHRTYCESGLTDVFEQSVGRFCAATHRGLSYAIAYPVASVAGLLLLYGTLARTTVARDKEPYK